MWEEYIPGGSIAAARASEKQLLLWLKELCQVLDFLHSAGIIHRDIKPSNLLVGADGHIRLIDFDAARLEKNGADSDTRLLGTRGFAPPEQYGFSQTDARSDIYALGITFRTLLGERANTLRWRGVLRRCTSADPAGRFRRAGQIPRAYRMGLWRRRALYPLLLLALLAGAAMLPGRLQKEEATAPPSVSSTAKAAIAEAYPTGDRASVPSPAVEPEAPWADLSAYDGVWYASNLDERSGFPESAGDGTDIQGFELELRTYEGRTWAYLSYYPKYGGDRFLWENDDLLPVENQGGGSYFIRCDMSDIHGPEGVKLSRSADGTLFFQVEGICTRMPLLSPDQWQDGAYAEYDRANTRLILGESETTVSVFECEALLTQYIYGIWFPEDEPEFVRAYLFNLRREDIMILGFSGEPAWGDYHLSFYYRRDSEKTVHTLSTYAGEMRIDGSDEIYITYDDWSLRHDP